MDNMAYLQQIAVEKKAAKDDSVLKKIFNPKIILGVLGFIVFLVALVLVLKVVSKSSSKDKDYLTQSYFSAKYLNEKTVANYGKKLRNSDLRDMTVSLKSVLNEISVEEGALLKSEYDMDLSAAASEEIATNELGMNSVLNATLDDGVLNGILERVYVREMTMQIAYIISYHTGCLDATKNSKVKTVLEKELTNLQNIYDQFYNFKSPMI